MRIEASRFSAKRNPTAVAAIIAAAAIGVSGPAFAASCGVSGSAGQSGVHAPVVGTNVISGSSGSTHGTAASACPPRTNVTITTNSAMLRAAAPGAHVYNLPATHHNVQTTHLQTPVGTVNRTVKKPKG